MKKRTLKIGFILSVIALVFFLSQWKQNHMESEMKRCSQFQPRDGVEKQYTRQDCIDAGCRPYLLGEWSCIGKPWYQS